MLLKRGLEVHIFCASDGFTERVKSLGVSYHDIRFSRFVNPFGDANYFVNLYRIFRREGYQIVHNFTIKPNIYGTLAAKLNKVPRIVATVEGLGFTFSQTIDIRSKFIKYVVKPLLQMAFMFADRIWFLNKDDLDLLVTSNIAEARKCILIRSIGVNVSEFSIASIDKYQLERLRIQLASIPDSLFISMIVSRLVWSKGVAEYVKAAESLLSEFPNVSFILVGPVDNTSPDAVPSEFLQSKLPDNLLWYDFREDIREILALSDAVILPSYYGEGVPRILLEAMSMGKPIITTINVGCKEVVEDGRNGYLVPVKDVRALREAIKTLLMDKTMRLRFGQYSRIKVEREFDENQINYLVLQELYGAPDGCT